MSAVARLIALTLMVTSVALISTPAKAWMSQSQEQSTSQTSEFKCEGFCSGTNTMKSESSVWQSQSQSVGQGKNTDYNRRFRNSNWSESPSNGEVRLTWSQRGGTCQIRYTEFGSKNYNYSTSTACDNGGITIGGLQYNKSYKFQVRKDDEAWSTAIVRRAR